MGRRKADKPTFELPQDANDRTRMRVEILNELMAETNNEIRHLLKTKGGLERRVEALSKLLTRLTDFAKAKEHDDGK